MSACRDEDSVHRFYVGPPVLSEKAPAKYQLTKKATQTLTERAVGLTEA